MPLLKLAISAGFHTSRESSNGMTEAQRNTKEFFEENKGEMHVGRAVCFSHDIRINQYVRPKFDREFIGGWSGVDNRFEPLPSLNFTLYLR